MVRMLILCPMRFVFALVIFAIAFSGYSAGSHAFVDGDCAPLVKVKAVDKAESSDHTQKQSDKSKGVCLDCNHCCTSVAALSKSETWSSLPQASVKAVDLQSMPPQGRIFSLLRPPKNLV